MLTVHSRGILALPSRQSSVGGKKYKRRKVAPEFTKGGDERQKILASPRHGKFGSIGASVSRRVQQAVRSCAGGAEECRYIRSTRAANMKIAMQDGVGKQRKGGLGEGKGQGGCWFESSFSNIHLYATKKEKCRIKKK